jgi:LuxR family maltose regulon positive regulatory protein
LRQAAATFEEAIQLAPETEMLQAWVGRPAYFIGMADLLREWNDLDASERHIAQWMELMKGNQAVDAEVITLGYIAQARLQFARGEYHESRMTLDSLTQHTHRRHFVPHLLAHAAAVQAQMELAQGNLAMALHWVDISGLFIYVENPCYLQERAYLTLARIRIVQGRTDPTGPCLHDALDLLTRLLVDAQAKARMNSVREILILRALAFDARGNRTEALGTLERALLLAEPEGYNRLVIDEGEPMVALLHQALARGLAPGYVAILLVASGEQVEPDHSLQMPRVGLLVEPLSERELDVLRLLVPGFSNSAIAQELVVSLGTVKRHVYNIYGKLGVHTRVQAVARAKTLNLL